MHGNQKKIQSIDELEAKKINDKSPSFDNGIPQFLPWLRNKFVEKVKFKTLFKEEMKNLLCDENVIAKIFSCRSKISS